MKNKISKKAIILLTLLILITYGYFISNKLFKYESTSGCINISKDSSKPIVQEINLLNSNKSENTIEISNKTSVGLSNISNIKVLDSNNKIILNKDISKSSNINEKANFNGKNEKIKIIINSKDSFGNEKINYSIKSR